MRLVRFGAPGSERPGLLDAQGVVRDASSVVEDWAGPHLNPDRLAGLRRLDPADLPAAPDKTRVAAPIPRPSKVVCVGLNYADHVRETGFEPPTEPLVFLKSPTALSGPFDPIRIPKTAGAVDWEVELACVIGREARRLTRADALSVVAGFAVANDVTDRGWQFDRGGQWSKAKSADTFMPLGPWLVPTGELRDFPRRSIWLTKNGTRRQDSVLGQLVFTVEEILSHLTEFMTLLPGDLVLTGTPPGVAYNKPTPDYLKPGDLISCGIDGLGAQSTEVWT